MQLVFLSITLAVGVAAGFLLFRLHVPGGMLVGAIAGVCLLNLLTGRAFMYPQAKIAAQIITGTYIGGMITRNEAKHIPQVIKPFLIVIGSLLLLNLAVGAVVMKITSLDKLTCLFCAAPGGMTDTALIAMDMGANGTMVTVMQFIRMIFGLGCLPSLILLADARLSGNKVEKLGRKERGKPSSGKRSSASFAAFLPTLFVGIVAGLLGRLSKMPAGTMSFSLIAVAIANITGFAKPMPIWLRRLAQVLSGCCIGVSVAPKDLSQLGAMIVPAVILCAAYLVNCVLVGMLIHRWLRVPLRESMLFLSPAGATEMALIAADMGITDANLSVLQICRLVSVNVVFPQLFWLILLFLG